MKISGNTYINAYIDNIILEVHNMSKLFSLLQVKYSYKLQKKPLCLYIWYVISLGKKDNIIRIDPKNYSNKTIDE